METSARPDDPVLLKRAFADFGLSEIEGQQHSPRVLELFKLAGHPEIHDDETAWCAAAVGGWLKEAGLPNTGSLAARSYVNYGDPCPMSKHIPRGAIIVWPRGAPPHGHVNVCLDDDGTFLTCIGGNQGNGRGGGVTISREAKAHALAARWPKGVSATTEPKKPGIIETIQDSKIAKAGAALTLTETGDMVTQITTAADQVKAVKGAAQEVGIYDTLVHLSSSPRFWIAAAIVIVAIGVVYWRWRDHAEPA